MGNKQQPLQIDLGTAQGLYKSASAELKKMLTDHFGEDALQFDITKKVKSYEDACKVIGFSGELPDISMWDKKDHKQMIASFKRLIIAKALNEGWEPNYDDPNERKWYPWFVFKSGSGFSLGGVGCGSASTGVGARLVFRTEALARYFGSNFKELHNDYLKV